MTIRKTDPDERLDMMLAQAERFAVRNQPGEAAARAKQVMAYCDREAARSSALGDSFRMRKLVAEKLIERLGRTVRDLHGHLRVDADDASNPDAWA